MNAPLMSPQPAAALWPLLQRCRSLMTTASCALFLSGCGLPPLDNRTASQALDVGTAQQTRLGQALEPQVEAHPGLSGIHALSHPHDAFAARALLARAAERTLDVQYYIWRGDTTGTLLLGELITAAQRGVRVRLLLDDVGIAGLDTELAALDHHANIEVRLFNPFMLRKPKPLGYLANLKRANRRMHNKSFTADNQATIIGGRNVGDEYFGATEGVLFADLDVLAVGPVVQDVSSDFDRYWASASAYPAASILPQVDDAALQGVTQAAQALVSTPAAQKYTQAIAQSGFAQSLLRQDLPLEWTRVRMVSDDPAKGLGQAPREGLLIALIEEALDKPRRSLDLVSPYFVPGKAGTEAFARLQEQGITVRVLTNAYGATDVPAVHAGYAKRRKALLQGGVTLYEMRSLLPHDTDDHAAPMFRRLGSSGSSLHAKTFTVDGERVFVGSFNFDPRSAHLNTELGFLIDSPPLAQQMVRAFEGSIPRLSYRLSLTPEGQVQWHSGAGADTRTDATEPDTTWWSRAMVGLLAVLPIECLL